MMIELPVKFHTEISAQLSDLGVQVEDEEYEIKLCLFNKNHIISIEPGHKNTTILTNVVSYYVIDRPYNEVKKLFWI